MNLGLKRMGTDLGPDPSRKARKAYLSQFHLIQWNKGGKLVRTNVFEFLEKTWKLPAIEDGMEFMLVKNGEVAEVFALGSTKVPVADQELVAAIELVEQGVCADVDVGKFCATVQDIMETPVGQGGIFPDGRDDWPDALTLFELKSSFALLEKLKPLSADVKAEAFDLLREYCPIHRSDFYEEYGE